MGLTNVSSRAKGGGCLHPTEETAETPQGQDFGPQLRLVSVYTTALQSQNGRL